METKAVNSTMEALLIQHELHTKLFHNAIEGIADSDATVRLSDANHVAWLAGNLVSLRYKLVNALGITAEQKHPALFKNNRGIQDNIAYPALQELVEDWDIISPILYQRLSDITSDELSNIQLLPLAALSDKTFLASLTFLLHREAYGIGQIGILRRIFGYEPMSYKLTVD